MKVKVSYEVFDDYLKLRLTGENPSAEFEDLLLTIKRLAQENNRTRILIDAFDLPDMSDNNKFDVGTLSARIFGCKLKCAMLRKPEHINKLTENVAVNRGARVYIESSEQKALNWLLK